MNTTSREIHRVTMPGQEKPGLVTAPIAELLVPGVTFHGLPSSVAESIARGMPLSSIAEDAHRIVWFKGIKQHITERAHATRFNGGKFLGEVNPQTLTILPPESRLTTQEVDTTTFMVLSEISSTGRPHAGFVEAIFTLYHRHDSRIKNGYLDRTPHIQSRMRLMSGAHDVNDITRLIETSQSIWAGALRRALRTRAHAGLPGLGRNR